jgi:hypothetical protein
MDGPKWTGDKKKHAAAQVTHKAVELRNAIRDAFVTLVVPDPAEGHYVEDEKPPGPIYPGVVLGTETYPEEVLDDEERQSGRLKRPTVGDKLNCMTKKATVSTAEPAVIPGAAGEYKDTQMMEMESAGAYAILTAIRYGQGANERM